MIEPVMGAPAEKRAENEQAVYDFLNQRGIPFARLDHPEVHTMEDCQAIDQAMGTDMCKNLFLCNSQKTKFYLLLLPGEKSFKTKDVSRQLGVARLSFGDAEHMQTILHIAPGAVSPMGLVFDSSRDITLVMDRQLKGMEAICCHPCVNTASIRLSMADFMEKFLPATGHEVICVDSPANTAE